MKPQNILLAKSGEAKVADFGIARAASATTMTQAGSILGTVHYISPEQALGEPATPRSDLYSLGVVLYEMLTGELPHDAETPVGVVMKHVGGLTRPVRDANPDVPEELDAIVSRLLARGPEERYGVAGTEGEATRAARLWGAAEALREAGGMPVPPNERALREGYVAPSRSHLGEALWERLRAEGRTMTPEQAVAYALEETPNQTDQRDEEGGS